MGGTIGLFWREVTGFPEYWVSLDGRLASTKRSYRKKILKLRKCRDGYLRTNVYLNGKLLTVNLHKLVCMTFHGLSDKLQVRHLDGNKLNNWANNVVPGTASDNQQDRKKHGTSGHMNGGTARKLANEDVQFIRLSKGEISANELSKLYGVSRTMINLILSNKTYQEVL